MESELVLVPKCVLGVGLTGDESDVILALKEPLLGERTPWRMIEHGWYKLFL